jgi:hypothetical protein
MVMKSLNVAVLRLSGVKGADSDELTKTFEEKCISIARKLPAESFIIDVETIDQAIKLIEYFNLNKLALSSYIINPVESVHQAIDNILEQYSKVRKISPRFEHLGENFIKTIEKVLFINSSIVEPVDITKGNCSTIQTQLVFVEMVNLKLGKIINIKNRNNKKMDCFLKLTKHELDNDPLIGDTLLELNLNLNDIKCFLSSTEFLEMEELKKVQLEISSASNTSSIIEINDTSVLSTQSSLNRLSDQHVAKKPRKSSPGSNSKYEQYRTVLTTRFSGVPYELHQAHLEKILQKRNQDLQNNLEPSDTTRTNHNPAVWPLENFHENTDLSINRPARSKQQHANINSTILNQLETSNEEKNNSYSQANSANGSNDFSDIENLIPSIGTAAAKLNQGFKTTKLLHKEEDEKIFQNKKNMKQFGTSNINNNTKQIQLGNSKKNDEIKQIKSKCSKLSHGSGKNSNSDSDSLSPATTNKPNNVIKSISNPNYASNKTQSTIYSNDTTQSNTQSGSETSSPATTNKPPLPPQAGISKLKEKKNSATKETQSTQNESKITKINNKNKSNENQSSTASDLPRLKRKYIKKAKQPTPSQATRRSSRSQTRLSTPNVTPTASGSCIAQTDRTVSSKRTQNQNPNSLKRSRQKSSSDEIEDNTSRM